MTLAWVDRICNIAREAYPCAWQLDGTEWSTGEPMRVLYYGPATQLDYLAGRLYRECPGSVVPVGRRPLFHVESDIRSCKASFAVIAGSANKLASKRREGDTWIPWWVDCRVLPQRVLEDCRSRNLDWDLNKVSKNDLRFVRGHTLENLRFFYDRIYFPTITKSHGRSAPRSSVAERERQFANGQCRLLFVVRQQKRVGGVLIDCRNMCPT